MEVCEPIELSFEMVSGVGGGIAVLDRGACDSRGRAVLGDLAPIGLNGIFV